jgi:hypothetical protein
MRGEFQKEIDALSATVRALERTTEHAAAAATVPPADIPKIEIVAAKPAEPIAVLPPSDPASTAIPPEIQVAIKAALSASLGHEVRIRSVKLLETPDGASAWSTQGRIAVQTSHNRRADRG